MSIRAFLVVALAVVCGLSAAWGMNQLRNPVEVKIEPETVPVLVTTGEIPCGQVLSSSDVRVRPWPKETVPPGGADRHPLPAGEAGRSRNAFVDDLAGRSRSRVGEAQARRGRAAGPA